MAAVQNEGQGRPFMILHLPDRLKNPSALPRRSYWHAYSVKHGTAGARAVGRMKRAHAIHDDNSLEGSDRTKIHGWDYFRPYSAEALKENVGITQTGGAAAVLIVVPASMEGLLCLLPDLLRHVCLETQVSFLTGHLSFTGRTTWGWWALHFADMFVLVQMFLQQFKSPPAPCCQREKFESSCLRALDLSVGIWSDVFLGIVKSDSPAVIEDFSLCLGWSWVHPTHAARVV